MAECPFCKMVRGETPVVSLYEDRLVFAFPNENPINSGHILVIPKRHHATLFNLSEEELRACILVCQKLGEAIRRATGASGMNLVQNNGEAAGQSVGHVHFHLIPRHNGDGFVTSWSNHSSANEIPAALLKKIHEELRALSIINY